MSYYIDNFVMSGKLAHNTRASMVDFMSHKEKSVPTWLTGFLNAHDVPACQASDLLLLLLWAMHNTANSLLLFFYLCTTKNRCNLPITPMTLFLGNGGNGMPMLFFVIF